MLARMWSIRNLTLLLGFKMVQLLWAYPSNSLKGLNTVTIWLSNLTPRHKLRNENTWRKNLYTCVHNSVIHKSQNAETTQIFLAMNGSTECDISIQWNVVWQKQEWNMTPSLQLSWTLRTLCPVKEASHKKKTHMLCDSYSYEITRTGMSMWQSNWNSGGEELVVNYEGQEMITKGMGFLPGVMKLF